MLQLCFPSNTHVHSFVPQVCLNFLAGLAHRPFPQQAVKGGDKIELGGGHTLEFVMAPNLHCMY